MNTKDLLILLNLFVITFNLGLGFYLFRKNRDDLRNIYFFAINITLAFIPLFELKSMITDPAVKIKWLSLIVIPLIFLPVFIFNFIKLQSGNTTKSSKAHIFINFIPIIMSIPFLNIIYSHNFFSHIILRDFQLIIPVSRSLIFFSLTLFLYFISGFIPALEKGQNKRFIHSFSAAILIPLFFLIFIHILIFFGNSLSPDGGKFIFQYGLLPVYTLLTSILISSVVLKYGSTGITSIATRTIVFSAVTIVLSSAYVILENLLENFFAGIISSDNKVYEIVAALIIAVNFGHIQQKITDVVEELMDFFKNGFIIKTAEDTEGIKKSLFVFAGVYFFALLISTMNFQINTRFSYIFCGMLLSASFIYVLYNLFKTELNITLYTISLFIIIFVYYLTITFISTKWVLYSYFNIFPLLLLLSIAFIIGRIISSRIDDIAFLIPLLIVGSILDIWSVFKGVTHEMVTSKSSVLDYLLIKYPMFHTNGVTQIIGISDFLFITILLGCVVNFKFPVGRNILILNGGFFLTFLTVVITSTGIPALPFISLIFILGNLNVLTVRKEDLITTLIVLAGATGVFYLVLQIRAFIS